MLKYNKYTVHRAVRLIIFSHKKDLLYLMFNYTMQIMISAIPKYF